MKLSIVILAAGQGTRMKSDLPKVLHPLAGRPLLAHAIDTAHALGAEAVHVVYGHGGERVRECLAERSVNWIEQAERLGTGHAVARALPAIPDDHRVLVLYGDVPLITAETLGRLLHFSGEEGVGVLTMEPADPYGYGRIVRDDADQVVRIVEQKDASHREQAIGEVNTGIVTAPAGRLRDWLGRVGNDNAQREYYLTDVVALAAADGVVVCGVKSHDPMEAEGVNDRIQLAALERHYQRRAAERLMVDGVTLIDPARFDLRGELVCGRDVTIDVNCVFEGRVELGDGVSIGPNCVIRDSRIGPGVEVRAHCVIEEATTGSGGFIGPFARLRPGAELADGVHVGNFVEVKKSRIGAGSKVNHLSYIGDTDVGCEVNIGAGTITCNYDGANKHRTVIGDRAFVGSATQLVAPVSVGDDATIGAGSTITRDAPAGELTLSRAKQTTFPGWKRPVKGPK
ncbi:bifunctional UDP-N-acetylglucosamine diphosphorylase/glucosamine-1-phosphate N-acetyltransferase GlmU [Endothiovibrio diazotrophicus]